MKKIAIIGVGQLGSRHLQGIKKSVNELEIWAVDSNKESLSIAQSRYEEISDSNIKKYIHYIESMELLPEELDIVIIATSSKPRAAIIKKLLSCKKVSFLILEKFLFCSLNDYDEIASILKDKKVTTFVNTPRRLWNGYKAIKALINFQQPISLSYNNKNWGLCCNAIHFFDLFDSLIDQKLILTANTSKLNPHILQSKRNGYIELDGILDIKSNRGDILHLECEETTPFLMQIIQDKLIININESQNYYSINDKQFELGVKYQSSLTGMLVDQLLTNGYCELPTYDQSSRLHKILLSSFINFINNLQGTNEENCPIT